MLVGPSTLFCDLPVNHHLPPMPRDRVLPPPSPSLPSVSTAILPACVWQVMGSLGGVSNQPAESGGPMLACDTPREPLANHCRAHARLACLFNYVIDQHSPCPPQCDADPSFGAFWQPDSQRNVWLGALLRADSTGPVSAPSYRCQAVRSV